MRPTSGRVAVRRIAETLFDEARANAELASATRRIGTRLRLVKITTLEEEIAA